MTEVNGHALVDTGEKLDHGTTRYRVYECVHCDAEGISVGYFESVGCLEAQRAGSYADARRAQIRGGDRA